MKQAVSRYFCHYSIPKIIFRGACRHISEGPATCGDFRAGHMHFYPAPNLPERNPSQFKHEPSGRCLFAVVVFIRHENNFLYS